MRKRRLEILRKTGRLAVFAFLAAASSAAGGCGLVHRVQIDRMTDYRFSERPPNYPIQITENDFEEPYVEIAHVTTPPYAPDVVDRAGTADLMRAARELGGDAVVALTRDPVVHEEIGYSPGALLGFDTRFRNGFTLSGVVVRFLREGLEVPGAAAQPGTGAPPPPPSGDWAEPEVEILE